MILVCISVSAVTAFLSSSITVRLAVKKLSEDTAVTEQPQTVIIYEKEPFPQAPPETVPAETTQEQTTSVPETTEPVTIAPETVVPVTEAPTEAPTEPVTNPSKSSVYATAVNSVVGVVSSHTRYTRTLLGTYTRNIFSSGSGFFVSDNGYVVTNAHVVENAESIAVSDYDGNKYDATLVARMQNNDIAVLKVDIPSKSVFLGSSSDVSVGDDCMIIGNPMGNLSYTYTDGMISYINRSITTDSGYTLNMFQTNCAINAGNSGGPVFNSKGEVIGIATAKYSTSEGLSFFIPIDDVKDFIYNNIA